MSPTRRDFVRTTGIVGSGLALGANTACTGEHIGDSGKGESPKVPLRILILGGTGFIGPHMVSYAVERGHSVSIFTRGQREIDLPESVERLQGDRNDDHDALEGRVWDVVLDNNAQDYRWVQKSTELLAGAAQQYV
jgi:Nucleoside-diphosphate-sugar epimerases